MFGLLRGGAKRMRQFKKRLVMLVMMAAMLLAPAMSAFAASAPGRVSGLKAKSVSETSLKLTWKKASKAFGYLIYRVDTATGAATRIAKTGSKSYTVKKLVPNTNYAFQVYAYRKSGKTTLKSAQPASITVAMRLKTPATPKNFKASTSGKTSVKLTWSKASNASGYYIYRYNEETQKYDRIASTKKTSYTVSKLTEGVNYKFAVQSYRTVKGQTAESGMAYGSGSGKGLSAQASKIHGRYFNATLRRNSSATIVGSSEKLVLKKGTKVTATTRSSKKITVILKDGRKAKVSGKDLRYNSLNYSKNGFSKEAKEAYVNEKGYSSNTKWLIWISQYSLTTNIFKGSQGRWVLQRSMPCVIGKDGKTPTGLFKLRFKDSAYGGVRIYFSWNPAKEWGNSFHRRVDGNKQGAVSHGCIRLSDGDLNYLNSNCPLGTTVLSY